MKISEEIKDFFYFTKSERNGIFGLVILIFLVIVVPEIYLSLVKPSHTNAEIFKKEISAFENSLKDIKKQKYQNRLDKYIAERYDTVELFYFDPNITSDQAFRKLGLTNKQIKTIRNYLNNGGKFYVKDDFRKIYGIRQSQYQILKPYLLLADKPKQTEQKPLNSNNNQKNNLFFFDPNTLSYEEWKTLGLTDKQIKVIENYKSKGGKFYKKEDLKKIYSINNETYKKLAPYIKIGKNKTSTTENKPVLTEINTADYKELIAIKGIGDYLAKNIIYYRNKLGGFINKKQLLEIKNFRKTTFDKIKNQIIIDTSKVKKININFAETTDLAKHPYINYNEAKKIVHYRSLHGAYNNVKILYSKKIISKNTYEKIKSYLTTH